MSYDDLFSPTTTSFAISHKETSEANHLISTGTDVTPFFGCRTEYEYNNTKSIIESEEKDRVQTPSCKYLSFSSSVFRKHRDSPSSVVNQPNYILLPMHSTSFATFLFLVFVVKHWALSFQPIQNLEKTTQHKMTSKNIEVKTSGAPDPLGPYSQAVLAGNTLYCSGNIAIDPKTGEIVGDGDVQEETRQVLKNMDAVLKEGGASASNVVRCTVFLDDLGNFVSILKYRSEESMITFMISFPHFFLLFGARYLLSSYLLF